MSSDMKNAGFRILFFITTPKLAKKAAVLFEEEHIPIQYHFHAQGTASVGVINWLGLDSMEKSISMSLMPKGFADEMLQRLRKKLHLGMPNTGVAFTVPLSGGNGRLIKLISSMEREEDREIAERSERDMAESNYSMIMAIINQGFSEEVMEAARPMGATGGSVFHCRRSGSEEAMQFWGIKVQPEREIVIILAKKSHKLGIMKAIGEKCGMNSEAQGIVFSMPVDGAVGMDEEE